MSIVMNMSSYEIEHDSMANEYGEEAAHAAWNHMIALACQQQLPESYNRQTAMPAGLATVDVDLFLDKMRSCQR